MSMQNHYNLLVREEEREIPCCARSGGGCHPGPLARGLLAGKRSRRATGASAQSDDLAACRTARPGLGHRRARRRSGRAAGRCAGPGSHRLAAAQAWDHQPNRGSHQKIEHLEDAVKALGVTSPRRTSPIWKSYASRSLCLSTFEITETGGNRSARARAAPISWGARTIAHGCAEQAVAGETGDARPVYPLNPPAELKGDDLAPLL